MPSVWPQLYSGSPSVLWGLLLCQLFSHGLWPQGGQNNIHVAKMQSPKVALPTFIDVQIVFA
eukprot:3915767-Amphidinium_carterae.1